MKLLISLLALAAAAQTGVPPRPASGEYPAHQDERGVAVGAAIVPSGQVAKIFTARIAKDYVVIEFALYPTPGSAIDLQTLDFALNDGADGRSYPATPDEVAWHGQKAPATSSTQGMHVTAEAGLIAGSRTDPYTGRPEHGVTGYGAVGVDNRPSPPPAQPGPADDPYAVAGRLGRMMFPDGRTDQPVAGYLYFPKGSSKRPQKGSFGVEYSVGVERRELIIPVK